MEKRHAIISVVDRLEKQLRHEIVYARGYLTMHRERYSEYLRDLRKARWDMDYRRAEEIIDDLRASTEEARRLQRKESAAYGRLAGLVARRGFTAPAETAALPPEPQFARTDDGEDGPPTREGPPHRDS